MTKREQRRYDNLIQSGVSKEIATKYAKSSGKQKPMVGYDELSPADKKRVATIMKSGLSKEVAVRSVQYENYEGRKSMLREIVESLNEGKALTITKDDWDEKHSVFNPLNPNSGDHDIFIGWNDINDEDSFGASIDGRGSKSGNFRTVASWLKRQNIILDKRVYDFAVKKLKF